jgi:acyl-coenzyme A synthetase/AMP-(fatty) acid ligase/thioesterase domain-containing protein/acyl carrier protein
MRPIDPRLLLALPGHAQASAPFPKIRDWTAANVARFGGKLALGGLGRPPLSHARLNEEVALWAERLLACGIGRGDVVAVALPNGPEAFVAMMAVASVAAVGAISPDEPAPVAEPLLARLPVKAVIVQNDRPTSVREIAADRGLPALEIHVDPRQAAGSFTVAAPLPTLGVRAAPSNADDAAFLVRTAGTTDAPKLVALSQVSLMLSSSVLADWLQLTDADRSLCVMPFTHLHSFIRSTLPVLTRGGMAVCCPGFDPVQILAWIDAQQPTMMTAAAGILRTMRLRIGESGWRPARNTLRVVVSGSDAIDGETAADLAAMLDVEFREFYGMSEVSPMLAGSKAGKIARADGAVGPVMTPWSVASFDDAGKILPRGMEGELAATGGLVNPTIGPDGGWANRMSGPWFLTGDRGQIDDRGEVHVTGRVDDRISRGGKKIAPEAIESVLMAHPEVRQALAFPMRDDILGDRIGSVIVPVTGCAPPERALRIFAAERMPDYMVPDRVLIMDSLPVSSTGKLARRKLSEQLAHALAQNRSAIAEPRFIPATPTERELARLVAAALQCEGFDLEADFENIGGNSFLALELLIAIEKEFGCQLSPAEFLADRSVAGRARLIELRRAQAGVRRVVPVQAGKGGPILFLAHAVHGSATYFNAALPHLGADLTVHALHWDRLKGEKAPTLESHAAAYLAAMRAIQPTGPYCMAGHSFAAHMAFEIAQQLFDAGEHVAFLAVFDDSADLAKRQFGIWQREPDEGTSEHARHMLASYIPLAYPGDIWLYRAHDTADDLLPDPNLGWSDLACGAFYSTEVAGDHVTMTGTDHVREWIGGFEEDLLTAWRAAQIGGSGPEIVTQKQELARARRMRPDVRATTEARRAAKNGDLATEITRYREAIACEAKQPFWVYRNLGQALEQHGDLSGAAEAYLASAARESIPIFGYGLAGTAFRRLGRKAESEEAFGKAEEHQSEDILVQRAMVALEQRRGLLERTEARLRRMVTLFPDSWSYNSLTMFLVRQGRIDEAIRVKTGLCDRYPSNPQFQKQLAELVSQYNEPGAPNPIIKVTAPA